MYHSVLTTKNLVSIHRHTFDLLYPFHPPPPASSLLVTTTPFSTSTCSFLFDFVCSFTLTKLSTWSIFSVKTSPATPIHFLYSLSHLLLALFYLPTSHDGVATWDQGQDWGSFLSPYQHTLERADRGHAASWFQTSSSFQTIIYQVPTRYMTHILTVKGCPSAILRLISLKFCLKSSDSLAPYHFW